MPTTPQRFFRYEINFYNKYRCRAAQYVDSERHIIIAEFDNTQEADDLLLRIRDMDAQGKDWRKNQSELNINSLRLFCANNVIPLEQIPGPFTADLVST
jgi:hypothetical protein